MLKKLTSLGSSPAGPGNFLEIGVLLVRGVTAWQACGVLGLVIALCLDTLGLSNSLGPMLFLLKAFVVDCLFLSLQEVVGVLPVILERYPFGIPATSVPVECFFVCNNAELAAPFELLNALLQLDETSCNLENSFLSKGVDECVGSLPDEDEALSTKGPTLLPELEGLKLCCCSPCIFETPAIEFL